MIAGIKVGLQKDSISDLEATKTPFCEVWFDVNRSTEYSTLFTYIHTHQIDAGLHYWGVLDDNIWSNLSHPNLAEASAALVKKTIDIAASYGFVYVNVHPGQAATVQLNLSDFRFTLLGQQIPEIQAQKTLVTFATQLNSYARDKNVIFTVETVPARVKNNQQALQIYELADRATMQILANNGITIANDFGHTAAQMITPDRNAISKYLFTNTQHLAPYTRLIHAGFNIPPYNGTDFHDSLENPVFDTDTAVPNKNEMISLLKLFSNRPDVWILVEPEKNHRENYNILKKLIAESKI